MLKKTVTQSVNSSYIIRVMRDMTAEDLLKTIIKDLKREQQHNNDNVDLISDAPGSRWWCTILNEDELLARHWFAAVLEELIASLGSGDEHADDAIQTAVWRCKDVIHFKAPGSLEHALMEPVRDQLEAQLHAMKFAIW